MPRFDQMLQKMHSVPPFVYKFSCSFGAISRSP